MKCKLGKLFLVAMIMLAVSSTLSAHHAMSLFDQKKIVSVTGKVTEFNWANPHATLLMDVSGSQGNVDKWVIEFGPPAQLHRDNGLSSESFKAGDQVTLEGHPYKDGRKIMRPTKLVLPDGREVNNLY